MDLSKLNTEKASNEAKKMKLRNPFTWEILVDENDENITFDLLGIKSKTAKNALADQQRDMKENLTDKERAKIGAEFLAKLTVGWSDNIELNGEKLKFSFENAVKLYLEEDDIAEQVLGFVKNIRNYDPNA